MITLEAERSRVTAHLMNAQDVARGHDTRHLDRLTSLVRELLLRELSRYRAHGEFPKNDTPGPLRPTFVDAQGVPCAMAHLLQVSGEGALASRIAAQRNHAFVKELVDEPRLVSWLDAAGLTLDEAAAIQPSYRCVSPAEAICGLSSTPSYAVPAKAVLIAHIEDADTLRIDEVYGEGGAYQTGGTYAAGFAGRSSGQVLIVVSGDGRVDSLEVLPNASAGLTVGQFQDSVLSSSESVCVSKVTALKPKYAERDCDGRGGCSSSGDASSLGILLALAGVLIARRF